MRVWKDYINEATGIYFKTNAHARDWFENSKYADIKWYSGFDKNDLIQFLRDTADRKISEEELISLYLIKNKKNPKDFVIKKF